MWELARFLGERTDWWIEAASHLFLSFVSAIFLHRQAIRCGRFSRRLGPGLRFLVWAGSCSQTAQYDPSLLPLYFPSLPSPPRLRLVPPAFSASWGFSGAKRGRGRERRGTGRGR
jgi:hypothetical protein